MKKSANRSNIGIVVPTMDRPDFVIRQLNYYASLNSPHTLYYVDSGNEENSKKIKDEIYRLKNVLNAAYLFSPKGDSIKSLIELISIVKEKYSAFMGDDDYWVPDTLSQCAEFLEKNPDYETAIGRSVTFKTENNAVYGKIKEIHDYPRHSIENNTASERLFNYLGPNLSAIATAVIRTDHLLKYYQDSLEIKDANIRGELLASCLMLIAGKSKVIDKLGFVRQIHDNHFKIADMFDWFTDENWHPSYSLFKNKISATLTAKDNISQEKAEQIFKQSLWFHFNKYLPRSYGQYLNAINPPQPVKKSFRTKIASRLPLLKKVYRSYAKSWFAEKDQLHYEVTNPDSKYYKDFKPIADSIISKNRE